MMGVLLQPVRKSLRGLAGFLHFNGLHLMANDIRDRDLDFQTVLIRVHSPAHLVTLLSTHHVFSRQS